MKKFYTLFAVAGFLFAVLVHFYIYAELASNRPGEKIHTVGNVTEQMFSTNLFTNGIIPVSESNAVKFVQMTRDAVKVRDRQVNLQFHIISIASILIFLLSICILMASSEKRKKE